MAQHRWKCWGKISSLSLIPCYKTRKLVLLKKYKRDFPGGAVDKNLTANAGYMGSIPGLGRSHLLWSNKADAPQPSSPSSRAWELQLLCLYATNTEACMPRAQAPREKPQQWALQSRVAPARLKQIKLEYSRKDAAQPKINKNYKKKELFCNMSSLSSDFNPTPLFQILTQFLLARICGSASFQILLESQKQTNSLYTHTHIHTLWQKE